MVIWVVFGRFGSFLGRFGRIVFLKTNFDFWVKKLKFFSNFDFEVPTSFKSTVTRQTNRLHFITKLHLIDRP